MPKDERRKQRPPFVAPYPSSFIVILLLALSLRLWLAPMRGHIHDVEQLKAWTQAATSQNPLAVYSASSANYPPLALLPLAGMGALYRTFFSPYFADSDTLTALLKLPAIAADLLTAVLIYCLTRQHGKRTALLCAAAYAFNPAVWYVSAWWGQLEALYTLPMLLAVAALADGRPGRSGAWLAAGVLVKPQAVVIAPALLVGSWKMGHWRALARGGLAAGLVITVVLAPFAWAGQLPALGAQLRASAGRQLFLTMNAHNLWYLLTLGRGSFAAREMNPIYDTQPLLGPLTGWQIGLVLLVGWCVLVCWSLWQASNLQSPAQRASNLHFSAAALVLGFFMLPAESHERYLFPALALLAPLLPCHRPARWLYFALSLTLILNLLWVDPAVPLPAFAEQLPWGVPVALANTAALVFTACVTVLRSYNGQTIPAG